MNELLSCLTKHWLGRALVGITSYVGSLGALKGMLPDLSRNELLRLYSAITGLPIVACLIAIWVIRKAQIQPKAREEWKRTLITSIAVKVDREDDTSQLVSRGQSAVVRPGERVTLTVELDPLSNLRRDYSFLATSKFGDVRTLSPPYVFEYIAPKHHSVDYIIIYATDQCTEQRSEQPFNVVIQE